MSSALCPNGLRPRWRQNASATNIQSKGALSATNTGREPAGTTSRQPRLEGRHRRRRAPGRRARASARSSPWIASAVVAPTAAPGSGRSSSSIPCSGSSTRHAPMDSRLPVRGVGPDVSTSTLIQVSACQSASCVAARASPDTSGRPGARGRRRRDRRRTATRGASDGHGRANGSRTARRRCGDHRIGAAAGRGAGRDRGRRRGSPRSRSESTGGDVVVDVDSGIFGHRVSMLDFTPRDLARFRAIGEVVGFPDRPPEVRHRARALRLRRPGQGPVLPRRLRLLRADPHHRPDARGGVRDPGPRDAREGALDPRRPDVSAVGGQVRQLPVRRRARRAGRPQGRPDLLDRRRGRHRRHRRPARRRAGDADLGATSRPSPAGASSTGSWPIPSAAPLANAVQHARRDLGGARRRRSRRSTASSTPTSRRSTSRRSRCRCSRS